MILDIISSIQEPREFITPFPHPGRMKVFTLQGGGIYKYSIKTNESGWFRIKPISHNRAHIIDKDEFEYYQLMQTLPAFTCVVAHPYLDKRFEADNFTHEYKQYVVVPFNLSDAKQRGWNGTPRIVWMCQHDLNLHDTIFARDIAGRLIFERSKLAPENITAHGVWSVASHLNDIYQSELARKSQPTPLDRVKYQLKVAGAHLINFENHGSYYTVTYSYQGDSRFVVLHKDLRTMTAGVCLAGRQGDYDLSAIVDVMANEAADHNIEDYNFNGVNND